MENAFVYEFLFRGGATSGPDDNTWHVILAREVVDINGNKRLEETPPMTPAQAASFGFTLSRIVSEINQTALDMADKAKVEVVALRRTVALPAIEPMAIPPKSLISKLTLGLLK